MEVNFVARLMAASAFVWGLLFFSITTRAQEAPMLRISSPPEQAVVQPGGNVTIIVNVTNPSLVKSVGIIGEDPLGIASFQAAKAQMTFTLQVPRKIDAGRYYITATGAKANGESIDSAPIALNVAVVGTLVSLKATNGNPMRFRYPGDKQPLLIDAVINQTSKTLKAELLSFVSSDPNTVTVNSSGVVTAMASGKATISASYMNNVSTTIEIEVSDARPGDLNADGQVDIDDANILNSFLNTAASTAKDARDLNHDGRIDALDARILSTLCTYPRCAYR
jgi:hypothetical protein